MEHFSFIFSPTLMRKKDKEKHNYGSFLETWLKTAVKAKSVPLKHLLPNARVIEAVWP